MGITFALIGGIVLGAVGVFLFYQRQLKIESEKRITAETKVAEIPKLESVIKEKDAEISRLREEGTSLKTELSALSTKLEEQLKAAEEKLAIFNDAEQKLSNAFKALSAEALKSNNTQFLELAKTNLEKFQTDAKADLETRRKAVDQLVQPLKDSLASVDTTLKELEKVRVGAYSGLETQIKTMSTAENNLKEETAKLVAALSKPSSGGLWGQMQLRNAVELAGMTKHCDFFEQQAVATDGGRLQPDMVIRLPRNRKVVVDSKVSFESYYESAKMGNENIRRNKLKEYIVHIKTHISNLASKGYWEQFQPGLECVVLFLPGEVFFSAALQEDPNLIQFGLEKRVLLVSPTTLIAVLLGIAYDWRQEQIAENAIVISNLGKELYERVRTIASYFEDMQRGLNSAVEAYNKAVRSIESRVLVTTRKFRELGAATGDEIKTLPTVDTTARTLQVEGGQDETPGKT
jgi:DNA recombination protein RmuC